MRRPHGPQRPAQRDDAVRWHTLETAEALRRLESDARRGLGHDAAAARLARYGGNVIEARDTAGLGAIVLAQFTDVMIVVLLAAAAIAGALGEVGDTAAIIAIVIVNAAVGALQEYRAEHAIAALRRMAAPSARVRRGGETRTVPAAELVPGNVVAIEAGDIVPADLRLLEAAELGADESVLTGESLPVDKMAHPLEDRDMPLGDRRNMAYKSTSVTRGTGLGLVVATGRATEVGRIAELLESGVRLRTPLQRRLAQFGRRLALGVLAICAVIFALGLLRGQPPLLMFLTAVSLAVAAVPEALPAVVTLTLAIGAKLLGRRNTLVRQLPAVEALGSVTFICSDKTGTLTENRMRLASVAAGGGTAGRLAELPSPLREALGRALALCNDVEAPPDASGSEPRGDPTELALAGAAAAAGFTKEGLIAELPRIEVLAFDSTRKRMTTLHASGAGAIAFTKGAPESVVARCTSALGPQGDPVPLAPDQVLAAAGALADEGYRVLAVSMRRFRSGAPTGAREARPAAVEAEMTLLGLVALSDPIRPEAPQAIRECLAAGVTPVMITGDHPRTAMRVAKELGITADPAAVMTGAELAALPDETLARRVRALRVYARVDPEQKIRIVEALQRAGEIVAMTGDGVNDAPALKRASIGVAMGRRGTDVAREAAKIVLLDDNFATIVAAVREGRHIYDNIRKFITYVLPSNSGEILVLLLAPFLGLPVPLQPIHILWVNLVTDGLPGLAFSAEPAEADIMRRPPRPAGEGILDRGLWLRMLWVGLLVAGVSLATAVGADHSLPLWQTMVFTTLVTAQLANALAVRSPTESLLSTGFFSNRYLAGAIGVALAGQFLVVYVPALNPIFETVPLPLPDLLLCLGFGGAVLPVLELHKWLACRGPFAALRRTGSTSGRA